jgi:ribosome-binding protein aMBF1 (putative translation factor)
MKTAKNRNLTKVDIDEAALTMAIAVLVDRIRDLSKEDKDDLFEVSKALINAETPEEERSAKRAYQEILDQRSGNLVTFSVDDEPIGLDGWIAFVSKRIKRAREAAHMTQEDLEKSTGLPQSHISRLENGVHSPSSSTLEKIAKATGQPACYFDPCHQDESECE